MDKSFVQFWNKKALTPPSIKGFTIPCENPGKISASLANIFESIIECLNNNDLLHQDSALISRLLFRTKRQMKSHKSYKLCQKVRRCLLNYLALDLLGAVQKLRDTTYGISGPNKESLEWFLIKLKQFGALLKRLERTCFEAAAHMDSHVATGNLWHIAILFFACLSRLWVFSRYFLDVVCGWYSQLQPFLSYLEKTEDWLLQNYELPLDLKLWLGVENLQVSNENTHVGEEEKINIFEDKKICMDAVFNEDLGEVISRDQTPKCTSKRSKVELQNCEDISVFLKSEQNLRQIRSPKSLTKYLPNAEWKDLRCYLKKIFVQLKAIKDENRHSEILRQAQTRLDRWLKKK